MIPSIRSFQITFRSGSYINEPIDMLHDIHVRYGPYDTQEIDTIAFYFHQDEGHIRNIKLRHVNNYYKVVFYTYYDNVEQTIVELSLHHKIIAYAALLDELHRTPELYQQFGQYILSPFCLTSS
jgi:hypothetical protein